MYYVHNKKPLVVTFLLFWIMYYKNPIEKSKWKII